jgi:hypothetical protein
MTASWKLEGRYMEACTCEAACPCTMLSDPTEGSCTALVAWHVDHGHYGDVSLDGLNVAFAVFTPGNMANKDWKAAVYLDDKASADQQEALGAIFSGKAGGHPAELAKHVAEVRGVSSVKLEFETDGKKGRLRIGNVGSADAEAIPGQGGKVPTIQDHPLAIAPGYPASVGRTSHARFQDHGIALDVKGRNALLSPFRYANS